MSKIVKRFWEGVKKVRGPQGSLLKAWSEAYGEAPVISFQDCVDAYLKDPSCRAFVDFLADQVVGMGFYTSADESYARAHLAKEAVDRFCEAVNLDGLLQVGTREVIGAGNSFWEKVEPGHLKDLRILPLTSVDKIRRDVHGNVEGYVQTATYGGKMIEPERIIHFKWNPINGEPFGSGILRTLLEELSFNGSTRMSFLEMKARIEKMLPEIFEKYAGPDELWVFEGISDDQLSTYQTTIKNKPKAGARFVYNKPADIKTVQIDPRTQFQAYLEHIWNQIIIGGHTPIPKLISTPGFTEASARAAIEVAERKVMALQRFIKRIAEREIFDPIVEQAGYDPGKAAVRLNWGMPEKPDVEAFLPILAQVATDRPDIISAEEFRGILIDMGLPLEKTQVEQPQAGGRAESKKAPGRKWIIEELK